MTESVGGRRPGAPAPARGERALPGGLRSLTSEGRALRRPGHRGLHGRRIAFEEAIGLRIGEAHVIRNAGGHATEDVVRSLVVSQRLLGTDEMIVIEHTGRGLDGVDEATVLARLESDTGTQVAFGEVI
jgi:hypothetical protein